MGEGPKYTLVGGGGRGESKEAEELKGYHRVDLHTQEKASGRGLEK